MELLIELIVWIFRTLFGEQEPPAKLGPRGPSSDDEDDRRGPYNYGDGRPGAGQPKTLAELLEEARRQSGGGRSVNPPPQVRPLEPRYQVSPAPVPQAQPAIEVPAPVFVQPLPATPAPVLMAPSAPQQVQAQGKKNRKRKAAAPSAQTMPAMPAAIARPVATPAHRRVGLNTGPRTVRARQLMPLFAALKKSNKANPGLLAAQAMVLKEVFGPPRALDPHRRGPMPR